MERCGGNVAASMESHGQLSSGCGVWWSDNTTAGNGCSGVHRLTVSRQLATDAVVCTVSQCLDSWQRMQWYASSHSVTTSGIGMPWTRSSEVSVLISGRLRRMVSEVFGKHFGVVYSWSTMSSSFVSCLAWCCIVESQRILSQFMHLHGSRSLFALHVCHVCCCASFHPHVIHVRLTLTRH